MANLINKDTYTTSCFYDNQC